MSETQIRRKLEQLLKTNEGKYLYLRRLEKKVGLLNEKTRKNFYKILGDLAMSREEAIQYYEKAGLKQKVKKIEIEYGDEYMREGAYSGAIEWYKKAGAKKKLKKALIMEAKELLFRGDLSAIKYLKEAKLEEKKIYKILEESALKEDDYFEEERFYNIIKFLKNMGLEKRAKKLFLMKGDNEVKKIIERGKYREYYFEKAISYYQEAGLNEKEYNVRIGDMLFNLGMYEEALPFYKKAKAKRKTKKTSIILANKALEKKYYSEAAEYFEEAGLLKKARELWIMLGDKNLNSGGRNWRFFAKNCYEKGGLNKKEIYEKIINTALQRKEYNIVAEYLEKIGRKKEAKKFWIIAGDKESDEKKATEYYMKGGLKGKKLFLRLGDSALANGLFGRATKYYRMLGLESKLKEAYKRWGDKELKKENFFSAIEYYKKAGLENKVREALEMAGDAILEKEVIDRYDLEEALDYYQKARSINKVKETQIKIAEFMLKSVFKNSSFSKAKEKLESIIEYFKEGGLKDREIYRRIGDEALKNESYFAVEFYEKAGFRNGTAEEIEKLAYAYEIVRDIKKAILLRKKIMKKRNALK